MSLVDLAGSERVESSGATGDRLKVRRPDHNLYIYILHIVSYNYILYAHRKVLILISHWLH